jgi:hypothetical protein
VAAVQIAIFLQWIEDFVMALGKTQLHLVVYLAPQAL